MIRALILAVVLAASPGAQSASPQTPQQSPAQPNTPTEQHAFTDADGAEVLHAFGAALEGHILSRFLATFDADAYPHFPVFAAEMDSYFGRYDQFRVHYLMKQTSSDSDGRGVMTAQIELEAIPIDTGEAVRRKAEVRFELLRSGGKWKIVGFTPREFLS